MTDRRFQDICDPDSFPMVQLVHAASKYKPTSPHGRSKRYRAGLTNLQESDLPFFYTLMIACLQPDDTSEIRDSQAPELECEDGYAVDDDECVDIDECADKLDDCDDTADCTNTEGAYTCECVEGFEGDGVDCTDIDECAEELDDCNVSADCTNTEGAYTCTCIEGFEGDGVDCTDIDECAEQIDDCPEASECVNTNGSYECDCDEGTYGDDCGPLWEEVAVFTDLSLTTSYQTAVSSIGDTLYFAPEQGDAFYSIDVTTSTLNSEEYSSDFCACGYTEILVSLDGSLYMFGNSGAAFDGSTWSPASYPTSDPDRRRGEAAGAVANGKIWQMGGRGSLDTVQAYSGGTNGTWTDETSLPWGVNNAVGYSPVNNDLVYIFGGNESSGKTYRAAVMDASGDGLWSEISPAPVYFYAAQPGGQVAAFDGRLLLQYQNELVIYDPSADSWWAETLPMPEGNDHVLTHVGEQPYVLSQVGTDVVLSKLHDIE